MPLSRDREGEPSTTANAPGRAGLSFPRRTPLPRAGGALPRSRRALVVLGAVAVGVLAAVRIGLVVARPGAGGTAAVASAPIEVPAPALAAHGVVQPIARATVATLGGGSVAELTADVGQTVEKGQQLARVAGPAQTEVVVAPWRGTVSGVAVHAGDTVLPGAPVLTLADLSRYRVETTDVDQYLIGRLRRGQPATVTLDAPAPRTLRGTVTSIALQAQPAPGGTHYPVIVDLPGGAADLRPGMTARIAFEP